ncbi:uncharacterized protein TrAtP1_012746 [Trichoderma atroviride]|uniref:uncharacterized protein n=1 Tax=Hypocrea atroviridis TaxID=63577 RepID=UPI0033222A00|nr:hypothetical protein TrAtP1_012746 [Trichoderma atroviride]
MGGQTQRGRELPRSTEGGRNERWTRSPEREGKRGEEKVVSVSVSASESLKERREREARGERRERMQWSKAGGSQRAPESGRCVNERR